MSGIDGRDPYEDFDDFMDDDAHSLAEEDERIIRRGEYEEPSEDYAPEIPPPPAAYLDSEDLMELWEPGILDEIGHLLEDPDDIQAVQQAIEGHLLDRDDADWLELAGIDIAKIVTGDYPVNMTDYMEALFRRWNAKLGCSKF